MKKQLVTILSGGLDSCVATAAYLEEDRHEVVHAVSFWYGQRHNRELLAAQNLCDWWSLPHTLINIDPKTFGKSALLKDAPNRLPTDRSFYEINDATAALPTSFVPGRNLIFIAQAAAVAYTINAGGLVGGWHWDDSSGYPDCRELFLHRCAQTVELAMDWPEFQLHRPLITLTKGEIIELGRKHNAPLELTWSCYQGDEEACGRCDTCRLRLKGFLDAGERDEIPYAYVPDELREAVR